MFCVILQQILCILCDTVSIRSTITQINLCEYVLYCVMRESFLNKMLQKLQKNI